MMCFSYSIRLNLTMMCVNVKTFYLRMKKKVFGSDEIEKMIDYLNIEDPMTIFFVK